MNPGGLDALQRLKVKFLAAESVEKAAGHKNYKFDSQLWQRNRALVDALSGQIRLEQPYMPSNPFQLQDYDSIRRLWGLEDLFIYSEYPVQLYSLRQQVPDTSLPYVLSRKIHVSARPDYERGTVISMMRT